jgi:hypothetical protein
MCVSAGESFDSSVDPQSKDGFPSRAYLKDEALALARQIGGKCCIQREIIHEIRNTLRTTLTLLELSPSFGLSGDILFFTCVSTVSSAYRRRVSMSFSFALHPLTPQIYQITDYRYRLK